MLSALGAENHIQAENRITWETLGNELSAEGDARYIQRFTIDADGPFDRLAFCMFKRGMKPVSPTDSLIEILPGYFAVASERFGKADGSEPVVVDIVTNGSLRNISYKPDGMHLVVDGRPVRAENIFKSTVSYPAQYVVPTKNGPVDKMIYGPEAYVVNDSLRSALRPAPYMQIPTPKSVILTGARSLRPITDKVRIVPVSDNRNDYYRVEIADGIMTVYTNSSHPARVVESVMRRVDAAIDADGTVPAAVMEDWADLPYRGLMIDISRNFTPADSLKKIIDVMSRYGLNVLHLHAGDDEGWRLEIPELPELTSVGARRGYATDDDVPFLKQIYSGDGDPNATDTPANGYYSTDEFVGLLKYAAERGIDIIPEFDTPAHSRAAIRAMEQRYRRTGDASLRLIHDGDTSRYTSAQSFHDNTMNPALEGPYKFWDIVIGSVASTYGRAGVPLRALHVGGDEVARHVWDGSDAARSLMTEQGMTDQRQLHAYFVRRVAEIAARHGVPVAGWQEIALNHSPGYDAAVMPNVAAVNCWTNAGGNGVAIASKGYPLILSNVDYLYFDQTLTTHPEEPGLVWGGIVDEFSPLHATVDRLCPASPDVQANVKGISGHLFTETVRSTAMIERYILPRLLGLAERAHNVKPTITDEEYFGQLISEMEEWASEGRNFYLRQPGIRLIDGMVEMNEPYGLGEIRYTLDGSEPNHNSSLYTSPFKAGDADQIRARLYYGPAESVTSILFLQ